MPILTTRYVTHSASRDSDNGATNDFQSWTVKLAGSLTLYPTPATAAAPRRSPTIYQTRRKRASRNLSDGSNRAA